MRAVFTTGELLARLSERKIRNSDVAQVLGVHPSRVTEIYKGVRTIKLDEAAKLVTAFELESPPSPPAPVLPVPIARLLVLYLAGELAVPLDESQLRELSEDVRAFAEFVAGQKPQDAVRLTEAFFQAMRLRRPISAPVDRQESGPQSR